MHVKELPVVILAAGESHRFDAKDRTTHKSLLKFTPEESIFEIIIKGLVHNKISRVYPILGYKKQDFQKFLQSKAWQNVEVISLMASKDYKKGPFYTLLAFKPHIEHFCSIIPSDTLFHPVILNQIFTSDVSIEKNTIFTLAVTNDQMTKFNSYIGFSPQFHPSSPQEIVLPFIILSHSFLEHYSSNKICVSGKIIDNLWDYNKNIGKIQKICLKYTSNFPPFIDIDTSSLYHTLRSVKKELLEHYNYK